MISIKCTLPPCDAYLIITTNIHCLITSSSILSQSSPTLPQCLTICRMGNTDSIPVVSQVKSLVQVIAGDEDGARKTQENFIRTGIVASQVRISCIEPLHCLIHQQHSLLAHSFYSWDEYGSNFSSSQSKEKLFWAIPIGLC